MSDDYNNFSYYELFDRNYDNMNFGVTKKKTLSKMNLIKTNAHNTTSDTRLSN